MNPSTLYFSKGWSLVQIALMVALGGAVLWLLSASRIFAEPPPSPPMAADFRPEGDFLEYAEKLRAAQPRHEYGLDRQTGGWFSILLLLVCVPIALWEIGIKSWRLLTTKPALVLKNGLLVPHAGFVTAPESFPMSALRAVRFDRADRVRLDAVGSAISAFSWSAYLGRKLGKKFRHILMIDYVLDSGEERSFKISDANVEDGVEHLRRFAAYLQQIRG